ncbi:hypothetical protein D3C76_1087790 [compost metagenome]
MSAIFIFNVSTLLFAAPSLAALEAAASPLELQPDKRITTDKDKSRKLELIHDFFNRPISSNLLIYLAAAAFIRRRHTSSSFNKWQGCRHTYHRIRSFRCRPRDSELRYVYWLNRLFNWRFQLWYPCIWHTVGTIDHIGISGVRKWRNIFPYQFIFWRNFKESAVRTFCN